MATWENITNLRSLLNIVLNEYPEPDKVYRHSTNEQNTDLKVGKDEVGDYKKLLNDYGVSMVEESLNTNINYLYRAPTNTDIPHIPYIAILNSDESKSTTYGRYVVYLFDPIKKEVYLTLNIGATKMANEYSKGLKSRSTTIKQSTDNILHHLAQWYRTQIDAPAGFQQGPTHISSKLNHSGPYNSGTIYYTKYTLDDLPSNDELVDDLNAAIDTYADLISKRTSNIEVDLEGRRAWHISTENKRGPGWRQNKVASIGWSLQPDQFNQDIETLTDISETNVKRSEGQGYAFQFSQEISHGDIIIAAVRGKNNPHRIEGIGRVTDANPEITTSDLHETIRDDSHFVGVDWAMFETPIPISLGEHVPLSDKTLTDLSENDVEHVVGTTLVHAVAGGLYADISEAIATLRDETHIQITASSEVESKDTDDTEIESDDTSNTESEMENEDDSSFEFEHRFHPLVQHVVDTDPCIYKFTAPPEYWPTVVRKAALGFGQSEQGQATWDDISSGDIILFHARGEPSTTIETPGSGIIGAGIVRRKTSKSVTERWWLDETGTTDDKRTVRELLTFQYLAFTGTPRRLNLQKTIQDQSIDDLEADVVTLLGGRLPYNDVNSLCRDVHPNDAGFPAQGIIGQLAGPDSVRGHAILDMLVPHVTPVAVTALNGRPGIDLPTNILEGLIFADRSTNLDSIDDGAAKILGQIETALSAGKNIILTGPPGTGKTEIAKRVTNYLAEEYPRYFAGAQLTTATADWSTFDTVGGYMPSRENTESGGEKRISETLTFSPGVVLNRWRNRRFGCPTNESLVIDEINRADIDKAFGQLFTILSGQPVTLPYTTGDGREIELRDATALSTQPESHTYAIPEAWNLFATMNTFDKASLYDMSYAFMRRFAFIRIGIPDFEGTFDTAETRAELVGLYIDVWDINLGADSHEQLATIWWTANQAMKNRAIGPAIVEDIATHLAATDEMSPTDAAQAIISYIFPQLEGTPRSERKALTKALSRLDGVDRTQIEAGARDMLGVSPSETDE